MPAAPTLRVGTDLCSVGDVEDSIERFGDRYLRRVYTDAELAYCEGTPHRTAERLAARFAAKEATMKVLHMTDARPDWRTIEVCPHPGGWCEIELAGSAADLARDAGIDSLAMSMSHHADHATAVVVATLSPTAATTAAPTPGEDR